MGIPPKTKGGHRRPFGGAAGNRTRLKSNANGLPEAAYSEGLLAQSHQKCGSQTLRHHFSYRWQIDTELFVDDAGSCPVKKQLPALARIAASVALLSVESSSAEAS